MTLKHSVIQLEQLSEAPLLLDRFLNLRSFYRGKPFRVFRPKWHQWRLWLWWISAWHSHCDDCPGVGVVFVGEGRARRRVRLVELPEHMAKQARL